MYKNKTQQKNHNRIYYLKNREKILKQQYEYIKLNRDKINKKLREKYKSYGGFKNTPAYSRILKYRYSTTSTYIKFLENKQKGKCFICRQNYLPLCIDHDHYKKKVRKLLCINCNTLVGKFENKPEIYLKIIGYVLKHKGV